MKDMKYQRFAHFSVFLAVFSVIYYGACLGHIELVRQSAVAVAQRACQQHSEARSSNRQIDCSPENAVVLESAVFKHRLAEARNPLTLALIAIGCLIVVIIANMLIG
jgi:hypothetical protein